MTMSSKSLTHFIARPETSSDGQSALVFRKHSDLDHLSDLSALDNLQFELQGTISAGSAAAVQELATFWSFTEGDFASKRLLGCMLVMGLPEEGVDETFDSLLGSYIYYTKQEQLPGPRNRESVSSVGRVTGSVKRPDLALEE